MFEDEHTAFANAEQQDELQQYPHLVQFMARLQVDAPHRQIDYTYSHLEKLMMRLGSQG